MTGRRARTIRPMPGAKRDRAARFHTLSAWSPLLGGLLFSLSTYLAFPPARLWPLVFVAAAALIWTGCKGAARPIRTGLLAAIGALPLWLAEETWLTNVTPLGYPLLALYLSLWTGLSVWGVAMLRSSGWRLPMFVAAPLVWLAFEVLRGEFVLTGYAWYLASHPLIEVTALALPARLLGAYFVSFLVVAAAGSLVDAAGWSGVPRRVGGYGAAAVALVWAGASFIASRSSADAAPPRSLTVGVVQTNLPQGQKLRWSAAKQAEDFQEYAALTRAVGLQRADLILWPETMFPGYALNTAAVTAAQQYAEARGAEPGSPLSRLTHEYAAALLRLQRELGIPMIVGAQARRGVRSVREADGTLDLQDEAEFNSALVLSAGEVLERRYDKVDLTPFGEVIPYVWRWPAVQQRVLSLGAAGMRFALSPGAEAAGVEVPLSSGLPLGVATPICFEVTRSSLCRGLAYDDRGRPRASLIVNLSNDGWFGSERWWLVSSDAKRRQHLQAARWRCMELGIPMVRAVNTGISAYIDSRGRLLPRRVVDGGEGLTRVQAGLIGTVQVNPAPGEQPLTFFGRVGNIFAWAAMTAGLALCLAGVVRRRVNSLPRRGP